ncbi:hypothetical protein KIL84_020905 [Mauremys mutica]|uniref:Uncharacterized protein n=1 Tax=Mauremys mutica TaxID=74926 RepID=A0A9D3XAT0_9SAUR|nr:hypothetical protein KIL84_020905 [Mauremys mutica]
MPPGPPHLGPPELTCPPLLGDDNSAEAKDWTLDVITKVGLVISLLCLLLAIITFLFCRALKGPRTTIHLHLCLALFIAYTVFLTGTSSTGNRVNAVIFVVTVWKLSLKFADINPDMSQLKKLRVLTITAIAQLCVLGTTWIFGMFQFNQRSLVASYIFTILNSLQGLFIFLLHCLLKKQASPVRDEYRRWLSCSGLKRPAKSSEFSSLTTTRQGLQPSQESGL